MKNLAIFYGGKSAEHDISVITAIQVIKNLDKNKYNIFPIYITKNNGWCILKDYLKINNYAIQKFKHKTIINGFFNSHIVQKTFWGFKKLASIDTAIICMHGLNGEDGTLAGLLELNNIPYVGSSVLGSSIGMDKVIQKDIFVKNNIPVAKYEYFLKEDYFKNKYEQIFILEEKLNYPMIVKPANLGSSIGINISKNREELEKNIEIALNFDKKVIVEEVIDNLREINCSVMGNFETVQTSMLEEPKNWTTFLDFNEKYLNNNKLKTKKEINVKLNNELETEIKDISKQIFKLLNLSGVIRIDFLLNNKTNQLYVNEINTIPGSFANYLWSHKYSFGELLDNLINLAQNEYNCKNGYNYTFGSSVLKMYSEKNLSSKTNNKLLK